MLRWHTLNTRCSQRVIWVEEGKAEMEETPSKAIRLWLLLGAVLLAALLPACSPAPTSNMPPQTGDGWQTADPASVGLDAKKLDQAVAGIRDGTYQNVHSLLVVKDGKLVFEEYFRGHTWSYSGF
jgi:hypothetical protein